MSCFITTRVLGGLALTTFLMFAGASYGKENAEAWPVTSAWVKEIPANQQAIVLTLGLVALNQKTSSLLEHKRDREQAVWVAKISACGYAMLSKVATKNPQFAAYLTRHSSAYAQLLRGELKSSQFQERDLALRSEGDVLMRALDNDAYRVVKAQYKDRVEATEMSLVVYAMFCAQ